jgi:hypothetical protein
MNKKIILLIICGVLIIVAAAYFYITKRESSLETSAKQAPVVNFNNQGDGVRYNKDENSIELYDNQSDSYKKVVSVNSEPIYSEISPDKKYLLYATEVSDSYEGEENLSVIDVTTSSEILSKQKIYSPRFTANGKVVYQLIEGDSSVLKISDIAGLTQTITLPISEQGVIEPIDENYLVVYEFSYDVGEATAYLVDVTNNTSSKFATGEGLKIKTVLNSKYAAIQTITDGKIGVQILQWETKQVVRNIDNIALDDIDWKQDTYYVYAKSGAIYKSSFESITDTKIANAPDPIVQLKLIVLNKLFISSTEKSYTTTF